MKSFSNFPVLFPGLVAFSLLFSCTPQQAYYLKKMPDSDSYAIRDEEDVDSTITASAKNEEATDLVKEDSGLQSKMGKLELVERGDRNAQMTGREELIMEALHDRYKEMAQTAQ